MPCYHDCPKVDCKPANRKVVNYTQKECKRINCKDYPLVFSNIQRSVTVLQSIAYVETIATKEKPQKQITVY